MATLCLMMSAARREERRHGGVKDLPQRVGQEAVGEARRRHHGRVGEGRFQGRDHLSGDHVLDAEVRDARVVPPAIRWRRREG